MPPDYHRLSIQQKQRSALDQARERPMHCPTCETAVMPSELLQHIAERCPGPRDPHPAAKWVTWAQALETGVPRRTLLFWIKRGYVRHRGARGDRRYLLRDLVRRTAVNRRR